MGKRAIWVGVEFLESAEYNHSAEETQRNGDGKTDQVCENVKYPGGFDMEQVGVPPSQQGSCSGDDEEDDPQDDLQLVIWSISIEEVKIIPDAQCAGNDRRHCGKRYVSKGDLFKDLLFENYCEKNEKSCPACQPDGEMNKHDMRRMYLGDGMDDLLNNFHGSLQ